MRSPLLDARGAHCFSRALIAAIAALAGALAPACGDSSSGDEPTTDDASAGDTSADDAVDEPLSDVTSDSKDAADATPPPCSGPGPSPDPWSTLAHDGRRTSASNGCIHADMTEAWRFDGKADGEKYFGFYNAVADKDGVFVHLPQTAPTVARVAAATGKQTWKYSGPADYDLGNWLTIGLGHVLVDDDGVYLLDATSGKLKTTSGVDWWGQTAADETRFYVVTTTHGDGPGAFVGAWDVTKGLLWKANQQGGCDPALGDTNGALAVNGGVVYFAPRYSVNPKGGGPPDAGAPTFPSGLYAFDAATGTKKWSVPLTPQSSISVGGGNVYMIEAGPALVARHESDGAVAWKAPLTADVFNVGSQPPVIASGRVMIATNDHVLSFDAATGAAAWSTAIARASFASNPGTSINFVSCPSAAQPAGAPLSTTLAAATASDTLIVTGGDAIHVLSLATGGEQGKVSVANASNPIIVGDRLYVLAASSTGGAQIVAYQSH